MGGDVVNLGEFLLQARAIAVPGAHPNPTKAAYLARKGYAALPVKPACAGRMLRGQTNTRALRKHLAQMLAARPRPVWLQTGIANNPPAEALWRVRIQVAQNRCPVVHQQLVG